MLVIKTVIPYIAIVLQFRSTTPSVIQNASIELHGRLFENYEKDDIPSLMQAAPLTVSLSYHLTAIMDLNELTGEMVTVGYLTAVWVDQRLTWNPLEFAGITYLMLTSTKVCRFRFSLLTFSNQIHIVFII